MAGWTAEKSRKEKRDLYRIIWRRRRKMDEKKNYLMHAMYASHGRMDKWNGIHD